MAAIPPREVLASLTQAADAVVPTAAVGVVSATGTGHADLLYSYTHGIGAYRVPVADLPEALRPDAEGIRHADAGAIFAAGGVVDWHLGFAGVRRVLSVPMPGLERPTRFWVGLADAAPLTAPQLRGFETVGTQSVALLSRAPSAEDETARLRRLEQAAALLPALFGVLDVRDVFERLSQIGTVALPHDTLTLGIFNDDLTKITLYAQTGHTPDVARVFPQPYPAFVSRDWDFDILDDRLTHPLEADRPVTRMGMRSSVRVAIRIDDVIIGGVSFNARRPNAYASVDVDVARRLADHVGVALSHQRLAQRLADEARRHEELQARAAKADLLDQLLASVTSTGELRDQFDRISSVTQAVLPHDALLMTMRLPDGRSGQVYAAKVPEGAEPFPEVVEVPPHLLANPGWESDLVADLQAEGDQQHLWPTRLGYRGALRLPLRLDNDFVAGLTFLSLAPGAFQATDIAVARRIADRLAVPFARERGASLLKRVDEATARAAALEARVRILTEELDARTGYRRVVGETPEWRRVLTQATQVAATATTVLLLGESGTGKEVIARFLHRASPRHQSPFLALNCAALPEQLLEAELFGYERGAFTGATQSKPGQLELAAGGTLFLDEVGEMSLPAQAKFLRVLQEREFQRLGGTRVLRTDARIVAATNRDLPRAIAHGQFREDLYYRLNVFAIRLPALRDRRADVVPLSEAFLAEIGRGLGRPPAGISRDARARLMDYEWPGNVRELRNVLERAAILCDGGLITADHLALNIGGAILAASNALTAVAGRGLPAAGAPSPAPPPITGSPASAGDLHALERDMIDQALQRARFNKSKAAKALGLTRQQLYHRMRRYGLE
jgi:transcriptional regulator with GAF, ATPase, and Fis domain